ncbi:MAG: exodeoxyribonuclease VII large subunit [Butyricicoccus sp.]
MSSFPKSGQVQLYLADMMPDGAGALHMQFEQLKAKLYAEGLFDTARKRPLPEFPEQIALITSPSGAAVRDMLRILARRWPLAEVELFPALVQGTAAPASLVQALQLANRRGTAQVIVIGRGGGALEDLWAFNDEKVARAIAASRIPVVSAVGHEPDVTISDFVADLRAPTPSGAAELIVPNQEDVRNSLRTLQHRLHTAMQKKCDQSRLQLNALEKCLAVCTPLQYLQDRLQNVQNLQERLRRAAQNCVNEKNITADYAERHMDAAMQRIILQKQSQLAQMCTALDALSPLKVLKRGYAVAKDQHGGIVINAAELSAGDCVRLRFAKGEAVCEVLEVRGEE